MTVADPNVPSALEVRLLRVLHALEASVEPIESEAQRVADEAARVLADVEAEGRAVAQDLGRRATSAEATLKNNFWTTLLVALGLGVVAGLLLRRGHDRR
jgi:ElaB/YqjD/DUF883 family membrane-anchored ribosome-binding protein